MLTQRKNETLLHYWISFWPTAPLFGVAWRFEKAAPFAAFFSPSAVMAQMTRAGTDEAVRAADEAIETGARAARETVETAVETAIETAELAEHAVEEAVETALHPVAAAAAAAEAAAEDGRPSLLYSAPPANVDDLKLIKGVGPKLERMLNELGIYTFAQIAAFDEANLAWVDANLESFKGRPFRDDWVAQAQALS